METYKLTFLANEMKGPVVKKENTPYINTNNDIEQQIQTFLEELFEDKSFENINIKFVHHVDISKSNQVDVGIETKLYTQKELTELLNTVKGFDNITKA